jgi:asparagine synthase (glutamine-hydrolysing)
MCGFAGLLRWDGLLPEDGARVRAAADVLTHRGPDGSGFHADSKIALGFRRLKIIDLSPAGDQPMSNEDGSLWIVFNGEIYNYRELREELLKHGHTFKSQSDTEVLLHGYETWGEEMLPKLRGMFALAISDSKNERVFLARDPLGVKPLYFAEREGFIAFASEPKALFALGIKPEIDPVAISEALTYRYVPAPRSGFKDVEKLPPGNLAIVEKGTLQYRRWWTFAPAEGAADYSPAAHIRGHAETTTLMATYGFPAPEPNYHQWLGMLAREKAALAIKCRAEADVPLGVWLSGGIDSALVASRMSCDSFCAGFSNPEYDERAHARSTAHHINSQHTDFEVPVDVFRLLPQIVWHADEPYFDSSCLPTFVLAEKTKPHATVVLSGDGGDEAFAGYDRYVGMGMLERYKKVPSLFRELALAYAKWRYPTASRQGWDRMLRWLEKCRVMEASGHHPYIAAMELFSEEQKAEMFGEAMSDEIDGQDARETLENALLRAREAVRANNPTASDTSVGVLQRADLETYLPGDVLHKVDRMSMAHGLEVRSPFLDVDLLAFALSLPDKVRLPGRQTKPLLRTAAAQVLPPEVVSARKKGFGVPLDDWFRGPLQKTALKIFDDSHLVADKLFKPRFWETIWREHQDGRAQHGERLYALLALELWYRTFITGSMPTTRPEPLNVVG